MLLWEGREREFRGTAVDKFVCQLCLKELFIKLILWDPNAVRLVPRRIYRFSREKDDEGTYLVDANQRCRFWPGHLSNFEFVVVHQRSVESDSRQ